MSVGAPIWWTIGYLSGAFTAVVVILGVVFLRLRRTSLSHGDPLIEDYTTLNHYAQLVWTSEDDTLDDALRQLIDQATATAATKTVAPAITRIISAAQQWSRARTVGDTTAGQSAFRDYSDAYALLRQRINYDLDRVPRPLLGWSRRRAGLPYRPPTASHPG